jgi:hypothetical protein
MIRHVRSFLIACPGGRRAKAALVFAEAALLGKLAAPLSGESED